MNDYSAPTVRDVPIALVTLRVGERAYFDVSAAQLSRYAARHGYELHVSDGAATPEGRDVRWGKVAALLSVLDGGAELALYLDADCVLVDESRPVTDLLGPLGNADLLVGRDSYWHANTGALLVTRAARDIVQHWDDVPWHYPETATTWPVDELAFNQYVWPDFAERIACPVRVVGEESDFVTGPFVRHCMNGTEDQKRARMLAALGER